MRFRRSTRRLLLPLLIAVASCDSRQPEPPPPAPPPLQFEAVNLDTPPRAAAGVARGERLGRVLGCTGCHGRDLTGHAWSEDPREAILFTSNLTRTVPLYDDRQLERALRSGVRHDGSPLWEMPSELFRHLSEPDMSALVAWLRTLRPAGVDHPRIVIGPVGRRMIAAGEIMTTPDFIRRNEQRVPPPLDGRHEWARYMIRATCAECHGMDLVPEPGDDSPNLDIVGGYSRAQFHHLLRTGEPVGGRRLGLMRSVALGRFVHLTGREVDAIYDYLSARAVRPQ